MKPIYLLMILGVWYWISGCKSDSRQTTDASPSTAQAIQAQPPVETGNTNSELGHDYAFLTQKMLHYKNVFGGSTPGGDPLYKDEWIDLIPNGTFKAGKLKNQTHTGTWTYHHDGGVLSLQPDNGSHKRSEWKVQHNQDMLVWTGTSTYGDQAVQIRLIWSNEFPE